MAEMVCDSCMQFFDESEFDFDDNVCNECKETILQDLQEEIIRLGGFACNQKGIK